MLANIMKDVRGYTVPIQNCAMVWVNDSFLRDIKVKLKNEMLSVVYLIKLLELGVQGRKHNLIVK